MTKYKLKSPFEAEIYKEGIEDGFLGCSKDGECIGDFREVDSKPNILKGPYILTPTGKQKVSIGDYVVTFPSGEKHIYDPEKFKSNFQELQSTKELTVSVDIRNFDQFKLLLTLIKYLYSAIDNENTKKYILDEISHIKNVSDYKNKCEIICNEFNRFKDFILKHYADEIGDNYSSSTFIDSVIELIKKRDKQVYELFKALDDIDSLDDIAKGNNKFFRESTGEFYRKRFVIADDKEVDRLYNIYYEE